MTNKGIFNMSLFDPKLRGNVQNSLLFYQKLVGVHQKIGHIGNSALVRDYYCQTAVSYGCNL